MTDDRIKEEFDKWHDVGVDCTKEEVAFYEQYPTDAHIIAVGYYAGFRAAERLAKIEALESVLSLADCGRTESLVSDIQDMIDELKEAGE